MLSIILFDTNAMTRAKIEMKTVEIIAIFLNFFSENFFICLNISSDICVDAALITDWADPITAASIAARNKPLNRIGSVNNIKFGSASVGFMVNNHLLFMPIITGNIPNNNKIINEIIHAFFISPYLFVEYIF